VLGRTGEEISIVGFPGLSLMHAEQEECTEAIHSAFDRGVNYFDVAPAYGRDGICEVRMGVGLQGIDRSKYFLSCKTKRRDGEGCREELERSLKRLKTDHFDLYQLHCLKTPEEVQTALAPGGAMETILKAQEEGKVRFIGFSAHTTKGAVTALNGFKFDTVMFPISFVEYFIMGFGKPVLELAKQREAAVLAIKPMCRGAWPKDMERTRRWWYRPVEDDKEIGLALRFTLSLEPVVTGIPPAWLDLASKAIEAVRTYTPITDAEREQLRQTAQTCESIFRREEEQVAYGCDRHGPVYPDSPHECFA
jgi:predicted aldo/keto reductase-like oxidoreductase